MTYTKFLKIFLPVAVIPVLVVLLLPTDVSDIYIKIVKPVFLLTGALLAFRVSRIYTKQLRATFTFLSAYLLILMIATTSLPYLQPYIENYFATSVFIIQVINYSMLVLFCINLLKVVDIRELNRKGWGIFSITLLLSVFLALYPSLVDKIWELSVPIEQIVSYYMIRVLDAALITILIPVIWLYVQYLKTQQKQSLTFTVIITGIVVYTLFDYLFQAIVRIFPALLAEGSIMHDVIPQMLYMYGYMVVAFGLYAHLKHDEWGFKSIERLLA